MPSIAPNRRTLVRVEVVDAEKRRVPSKHYSYMINVTWSDESETVIYRRYSKFFEFQIILLETFPWEGGLKEPSARIIPFLPGKILFRRSHVRDVAMRRLKPIDKYCKAIVELPQHISRCEHVLDFFETQQDDLNPCREDSRRKLKDGQELGEISGPLLLEPYIAITGYKRVQQKELTITIGQRVEVIEKNENGWWFVSDEEGERGWVPGVYLEKPDGSVEDLVTKRAEPGHGERYITTHSYESENAIDLRFGAGVEVEVLQKNLEGWWLINYNGKQGHAPASYLEKSHNFPPRKKAYNKCSISGPKQLHDLSTKGMSSAALSSQRSPASVMTKAISQTPGSPRYHREKTVQPPPKRSSIKRTYPKRPNAPPCSQSLPIEEPTYEYMTITQFKANIPDGVSFDEEKKVEVMEKSPGGWWFVKVGSQEGWAPASHIEKREGRPKVKTTAPPSRPRPPKFQKSNVPNAPAAKPLPNVPNAAAGKYASSTACANQFAILPAKRLLPPRPDVLSRRPQIQEKPVTSKQNVLFERSPPAAAKIPIRSAVDELLQNNFKVAPIDFRDSIKSSVVAKHSERIGKPSGPPSRPSSGPLRPSNSANIKAEVQKSSTEPNSHPKIVPGTKNASVVPDKLNPPARPRNVTQLENSRKTNYTAVKMGPGKLQEADKFPKGAHKPPVARGKPKPVLRNVLHSDDDTKTDFRAVLRSTHKKQLTSNSIEHSHSLNTDITMGTNAREKQKKSPLSRSLNADKPMSMNTEEELKKLPPSVPTKPSNLRLKPPVPREMKEFDEPLLESKETTSAEPSSDRMQLWNSETSRPVLRRFQLNNNSSVKVSDEKPSFIVGHARIELTYQPDSSGTLRKRGSPDGQADLKFGDATQGTFIPVTPPRWKKKTSSKVKESAKSLEEKVLETVLESKDEASNLYVALDDCRGVELSEISFFSGDIVEVLCKGENSWWFVKIGENTGWAPCSFLRPANTPDIPEREVHTLIDVGQSRQIETVLYDAVYSETESDGDSQQ